MAVLNKRAVVSAIEMYGVSAIRLPMVLGEAFNQLIKSLFANNEQGFAYDPNDLSTMFQDAAGTVPVSSPAQPIGLMLDKSKGLALGANVFTSAVNGYFDTGSTSEMLTGTLEKTTAWMSVTPETFYKLESNGGVADRCRIQVKNALGVISFVSAFSTESAVTYPRYVKTNSDSVHMRVYFKSSGGNATGLMVRAVAGNHAYQTTSASRPILQRNATTGAYYLAFDGIDDSLVTNNINFTATDKVSLFAGVRKLSDANTGIVVELSANANTNNGAFYLATAINAPASEQWFASRGTSTASVTLGTNAATYSAVYTAKASILPSSVNTRRNGISMGASVVSQGTGNYGNYPLYIGRRAGTSFPFNGHLYSLIGVGRLTTDSETAAIEKELAKRTGVTLNV